MKTFLLFAFYFLVIDHEKGECAVQGSGNGTLSTDITTVIRQLFVEAIRQQNDEQIKRIDEVLSKSIQQMKNQQETIATSLRAVDQRSQEQLQGIKNLNTSIQQMNNKQDSVVASLQATHRNFTELLQGLNNRFAPIQQMTKQLEIAMTSLQAIDRRSQEQDIYIKQVQSIQGFLNTSFQQMKTQHDVVLRNLEANDQRLREHDISIKNETKILWKQAIEFGIDLGEGPIPLSIINDWVVLLHRFDGSVEFNRNWTDYKNGFGDIGGEFWLGNEKIHRLTNSLIYTLHIEMQHNPTGGWYYADYTTFSVDSEANKYTLRLSGFSGGNAGDSLTNITLGSHWFLGGMNFSTWDNDNDRWSNFNCASAYQGGWWFNSCQPACLTCLYIGSGFQWYGLRLLSPDGEGRLSAARMMIRST